MQDTEIKLMKKNTILLSPNYFNQFLKKTNFMSNIITNLKECPEFPFFGATYPDATCIEGYLWDLDKGDENGILQQENEHPCPFCNTEKFIEENISDDEFEVIEDSKRITREDLIKYIEVLRQKYGY